MASRNLPTRPVGRTMFFDRSAWHLLSDVPSGTGGGHAERYTRKYRHWSPRWKWKPRDGAELKEFEREWGGFPRALNRRRRRHGSR